MAFFNSNIAISAIFVLFVSFSFVNYGSASNTVGVACNNTAQCTGTNEICVNSTTVFPACQQGSCQCKSCMALDSTSTCNAVVGLGVGATCTGSENELYPAFAECSGSTVSCMSGFTQSGAACISSCTSTSCCSSGQIYDSTLQACRKRFYGDSCSTDSDCQPDGHYWDALTYSNAQCIGNVCTCGSYKTAPTSYLNPQTGAITSFMVCAANSVSVNATVNTTCELDVVYESDSTSYGICASGTVCYACPELGTSPSYGNCKTVSGSLSAPPPVSAQRFCADCTTVAQASCISSYSGGVAVTSAPAVTAAAGSYYASWSATDLLLAQLTNGTAGSSAYSMYNRYCATATDCRTNEVCLVQNQCTRGICYCQSPNINTGSACNVPTTVATTSTTAWSTTSWTTTTTTATTTTAAATTTLPAVWYGMGCTTTSNCARLPGTQCIQNGTSSAWNCLCPFKMIWQANIPYYGSMCRAIVYGDPCRNDSECSSGTYTANGYKCINSTSTCGCATNYVSAPYQSLYAFWGVSSSSVAAWTSQLQTNTLTMCVYNTATINIAANGNCTTLSANMLSTSTYTPAARMCASGLTCLYCVDSTSTSLGVCVNYVQPSSQTSSHSGFATHVTGDVVMTTTMLLLGLLSLRQF